jgi:hypothetical protein
VWPLARYLRRESIRFVNGWPTDRLHRMFLWFPAVASICFVMNLGPGCLVRSSFSFGLLFVVCRLLYSARTGDDDFFSCVLRPYLLALLTYLIVDPFAFRALVDEP